MPKTFITGTRNLGRVILLAAAATVGCARWSEFHSVQPYAGSTEPRMASRTGLGHAPLVVVVAGSEGTEIFDLMAPYAILARTGALDVRVIARDTATIPLWRGLAIRAHLTFAELDASGVVPAAIVVPNLTDRDQPAVDAWIARHAGRGARVLAVCEGARIVARAGLLEGRRATSHSAALKGLAKAYRDTRWERGPRWVEDGDIITTAGVSASTEGSLVLVERLLGTAVRERVAREIAYPFPALLDSFPAPGISTGDKWRMARRALFGGTGRVTVLLDDGLDELALGATLDTWARLFPRSLRTVARDDRWTTTRHGLVIGPTAGWDDLRRSDDVLALAPWQPDDVLEASDGKWHLFEFDRYAFSVLDDHVTARFGTGTARTVRRTLDLPN